MNRPIFLAALMAPTAVAAAATGAAAPLTDGSCDVVAYLDGAQTTQRGWADTVARAVESAGGEAQDACVIIDDGAEGGRLSATRAGWTYQLVEIDLDVGLVEDPEADQLILSLSGTSEAKNSNNGEGWQYIDRAR